MPAFLKRWGGQIGLARGAALVVLLLLLWVRYDDPVLVEALRLRSFDAIQKLNLREETAYPVLIVDIDEASIQQIGQWPWPRTTLAELVDDLMAANAAAVGFDILFAEPDRTSPAAVARSMEGIDSVTRSLLESLPDHDEVFAASLSRCRCVLGYSVIQEVVPGANSEPVPPATIAEMGGDPRINLPAYPAVIPILPILQAAAPGRGIFTMDAEQDGLVRRVPLLLTVGPVFDSAAAAAEWAPTLVAEAIAQRVILPALSTEILRVATGQSTYAVKRDVAGITDIVIAKNEIPTDSQGQIWIRWGPSDPKRYVSAADVLNGTVPTERIAGKLILIGTSAVGLRDVRPTPVSLQMHGVEIHAQIIENVLAGAYLRRPNNILVAEIVATGLFGLLLIGFVPAVRASWSFLVLVGAIAAAIYVSWHYYSENNILVDPSFPVATAGALYAVLVYLSHYRTEKQRQRTAVAFSRYLSPVMAERVSHNPSALKLGGDERELTVLFTDVRGFTALSERYAGSPEALTRIINQLMNAISKEIVDRLGEIDKYMGDAAMAFWNAPLDVPNHPELACRAALSIQESVRRLNESWAAEPRDDGKPPPNVSVGVGLNTGLCLVGNLGSEYRLSYSVLGDPVNLASRVEGQTKYYGVPIVITETTQQQAPMMAALEIDRVAVKGKVEAVRVFALLGDETVAQTDEFRALTAAQTALLAAYRGQRWDEAASQAEALAQAYPQLAELYALYRDRIVALRADPPGGAWDGVYVALEK